MRHLFATAALFLLAASCFAATTRPVVIEFPPGAKSVRIDGAPAMGLLCVQARVNDSEPVWMLVDTGAGGLVLDNKFAEKLKLQTLANQSLAAVGGPMKAKVALIDSLTIDGAPGKALRTRPQFANVADLSGIPGVKESKIDGVIGMDVMSECPVTLDFQNWALTFHEPGSFIPPPGRMEAIQMIVFMPAVRVTVADRTSTWFEIDTGMMGRFTLKPTLYRLLLPDVKPTRVASSFVWGGGGSEDRKYGIYPSVEVFGRRRELVGMSFSSTGEGNGSNRSGGMIGMTELVDHRLTLDVAGRRLWLEAPDAETADALADRLLKAHADRGGLTPLMQAAMRKRGDAVRVLLDRGQDPNAATPLEETALFFAASRGDTQAVKLLLDRQADPNRAVVVGGNFALAAAAESDDVETLRLLLAGGAKVDQADVRGKTALYSAAEVGSLDCVRALIAAKANVSKPARDKYTPILIAAERGWPEITRALLEAGADPIKPVPALPMAAAAGNVELMRLLIDRKLDVNARLPDGGTALMNAALNGRLEVVQLLLEHGADPSLKSNSGKTALDFAISMAGANGPTIRALIEATTPATQPAK